MENKNFHSTDNKVIYYETMIKVSSKAKAFGLWEFSKELNLTGINRKGFLELLKQHGFYRRKTPNGSFEMVHIKNGVIRFVTKDDVVNYLKDYIENENGVYKVYYSQNNQGNYKLIDTAQFINLFLKQYHLLINDGFLVLLELDSREVLKDNREKSYLLFRNGLVTITKDGFTENKYAELEGILIFESQIIDIDFEFEEDWRNTPFSQFIQNVSNNEIKRENVLNSAIGYLLHSYNDPANSQAVILYDEELTDTDTPRGGTGKGIIGQALSKVRKGFVQLDGKKLNLESPFLFQRIKEDTRIIFIDDVSKRFDIDTLNSMLTEGISIEEKFRKPIHINKANMPRFLITSNIILPFEGTTRTRRQYIIELSNYYSDKQGIGTSQPIINEHGARFFSEDWTKKEWNGFYSFIVKSIQHYLANGLLEQPELNMKMNWLVQKIGKLIFGYFETVKVQKGDKYNAKELYENFKIEYAIDDYSLRQFSNNLQSYVVYKGMKIEFKKGMAIIS